MTTADQLLEAYKTCCLVAHDRNWPEKTAVIQFLHAVRQLVFPGYFTVTTKAGTCRDSIQATLDILHKTLHDWLVELAVPAAATIASAFTDYMPTLRIALCHDQDATFQGCPAADSYDEVILAYPGLWATLIYRTAHFLAKKAVPLIPRIMTEIAHSDTGIDIHPEAHIGTHFFIDHGTGIVIGQTAVIGNHVSLYQGVTIGALRIPRRDDRHKKRHPTLEDHVTVYARTTILGGDTVIGHHATIGGNLWITQSVSPHTTQAY